MEQTAIAFLPILAAGGGGELPHAQLEIQTLVWVFVIFGILLAILAKFAWKPLLAAVEARENRIAESLRRAEEVQKASEEIAARQQAAMAEAQAQAKAVLDEARADAERFRREEAEKTRVEGEAFLDRARREIALEENRARDALRREVVDLTIEAAGRVLSRSLTGDDDRRLAKEAVAEISARQVGAGRN